MVIQSFIDEKKHLAKMLPSLCEQILYVRDGVVLTCQYHGVHVQDPLNSGDDVSDADPTEVFDAENVIVCQFDKVWFVSCCFVFIKVQQYLFSVMFGVFLILCFPCVLWCIHC